jgi:hypothetical protein
MSSELLEVWPSEDSGSQSETVAGPSEPEHQTSSFFSIPVTTIKNWKIEVCEEQESLASTHSF